VGCRFSQEQRESPADDEGCASEPRSTSTRSRSSSSFIGARAAAAIVLVQNDNSTIASFPLKGFPLEKAYHTMIRGCLDHERRSRTA